MAKGNHFSACMAYNPDCPCLSCARDGHEGDSKTLCCEKHRLTCSETRPCPAHLPEEEEGEIDV